MIGANGISVCDPAGARPLELALVNVKYSENLGDGLIAESLEQALLAARPHWRIASLDLAGRSGYGERPLRYRTTALKALRRLPGPMRRFAVVQALRPLLARLDGEWRRALADVDCVVIGGGQLFQDGDLNFPLKIGTMLAVCRDLDIPVAVHAVGATRYWSRRGTALFARLAECRLVSVSLRDAESLAAWASHFQGTPLQWASVSPDPALLLDRLPERPTVPAFDVGICLTGRAELAYHAQWSAKRIERFYRELARTIVERGHRVALFGNGARGDDDEIAALMTTTELRQAAEAGNLVRLPRPARPAELVAAIARMRLVVGHRLHANIAAYALAIPSIGLGWDPKVESFFRLTDRLDLFVAHDRLDADRVVDLVERALASGIDPATRGETVNRAQRGLDAMIASIEATCASVRSAGLARETIAERPGTGRPTPYRPRASSLCRDRDRSLSRRPPEQTLRNGSRQHLESPRS